MKVSQMIKNLQEFINKHGDLDCWYTVDRDWCDYDEVCYSPSLKYVDDEGAVYDNIEEAYEDFQVTDVREICIVN